MKKLFVIVFCTALLLTSCTKEVSNDALVQSMNKHELMRDIIDRAASGDYDLEQIKEDLDVLEKKIESEEVQKQIPNLSSYTKSLESFRFCRVPAIKGLISYRTGTDRDSKNDIGVQIETPTAGTYVNANTLSRPEFNYCSRKVESGINTVNLISPDDWGNGLSVTDMLAILKHILRIKVFEYAEQILAADVNRDGAIDYVDIDEIEQIVLTNISEINNNSTVPSVAAQGNNSWVFVSESFIDAQTSVLQNYPIFLNVQEHIMTENANNTFNIAFNGTSNTIPARVAVKLGDVDFTAMN